MVGIKAAEVRLASRKECVEHDACITVRLGDQWFGLPIDRVQDVFIPAQLTRIPLAPPEIAGLLNLRGRVVTAISLRRRLGQRDAGGTPEMAVGIEHRGELYALLVDQVGDVLTLPAGSRERNPVHMDGPWAQVSRGVHALSDRLLVILDVDAVLALEAETRAV